MTDAKVVKRTLFKMLLSSVVCCLFIEFIGATLATDDSKVLVLDTKNLNKFDHGTDYKVILAKEDSRPPLPRQFTICNSGFFWRLSGSRIKCCNVVV